MKTFRWTVPECPPSRVEKEYYRQKSLGSAAVPRKDELKAFEYWEKVQARGIVRYLIHQIVHVSLIFLAMELLRIFTDPEKSLTFMYSGMILALILREFLSWRAHKERRSKIMEYLDNKQHSVG